MSNPQKKSLLVALALCSAFSSTAQAQTADTPEPAEAPQSAAERAQPAPAVQVQLGVRALHRQFDYHDTLADHVPGSARPFSFDMPLGPAPFLDLELFPLELSDGTRRALDVALIGGYEQLLATHTVVLQNTPNQATLQTASSQAYGGLRGRWLLGPQELGLSGAYGQHSFSVSDLTLGTQRAGLVPNVNYSFIRLGVDARLHFDAWTLSGYAGTRFVRDTGALEANWFPSTHTTVVEGNLSLAYAFSGFSSVVLGADYLRYAFDFNPVPANNAVVAGGAVDQYLSAWLGLEFHYSRSANAAPSRTSNAPRTSNAL